MNKNVKKYIYTPIVFIILGICVLSLPYYYQYKAYLSYANPSMEFAYRNSAIGTSILPATKAEYKLHNNQTLTGDGSSHRI